MKDLEPSELTDPDLVFQLGLSPNRIEAKYGDCPIWYLWKEDLIRSQRSSGRPQDLEDVRALEEG